MQVFHVAGYEEVVQSLQAAHTDIVTERYHSFDDFAQAVAQCHYVISPDTSVVHLCAAFGIPVVVLYLVAPGMRHSPWYPYLTAHASLTTSAASLGAITVDEVWEALLACLKLRQPQAGN